MLVKKQCNLRLKVMTCVNEDIIYVGEADSSQLFILLLTDRSYFDHAVVNTTLIQTSGSIYYETQNYTDSNCKLGKIIYDSFSYFSFDGILNQIKNKLVYKNDVLCPMSSYQAVITIFTQKNVIDATIIDSFETS